MKRAGLIVLICVLAPTWAAAMPNDSARSRRRVRDRTRRVPRWPKTVRKIDVTYPPGELLAVGSFKSVWAVKGRSDLVIAVFRRDDAEHRDQFKTEMAALGQLRSLDLPMVEIVGTGRTRDGLKSIVMRRYLASSNDHNQVQRRLRDIFLAHVNDNTARDFRRIKRALKQADVALRDAQVLIDAAGHLVVHDPYRLHAGFDAAFDIRGLPASVKK